jgi:hypothetical protein
MSRFRNCGIALVVLSMAACQKAATEERNDAVEAQREATTTAQEAANERQREVAEANKEAAKDISEARREARERSLEAVENEIQKTSGAQAKANEEYNEAARDTAGAHTEFAKDARERLDKIDAKSRKLHQELDGKDAKDFPADARTRLSDVDRESQSIRTDLSQLGTGAPQPAMDMQSRIEKRLDATEKALDNIDD